MTKRLGILLALFALLSIWLLSDTGQASRAREPIAPQITPARVGIPRHPIGHRAKVQNLDVLLAQGVITDPLTGNYQLIGGGNMVLAWPDATDQFNLQTYLTDADLSAPEPQDLETLDDVGGYGHLDVATGDLDDDEEAEIVAAWESSGGVIKLFTANVGSGSSISPGLTIDAATGVGGAVRLDIGDINGDRDREIALAWVGDDQKAYLQVFDVDGNLTPSLMDEQVETMEVAPYAMVDVATGDLDGNGDDEIVLVWNLSDGKTVQIYDWDSGGTLVPKGNRAVQSHYLTDLSVATGDFNLDAVDEIVMGTREYNDGGSPSQLDVRLRVFEVSSDLATISYGGFDTDSLPASGSGRLSGGLRLASGDFDIDGDDEIVMAYEDESGQIVIEVLDCDGTLNVTETAVIQDEQVYEQGRFSLAVGDVNKNLGAEIVLAWDDQNHERSLKLYQVDPSLATITAAGKQSDAGGSNGYLALSLGNLGGASVWVGPPQYSQVTEAKQLVAIINEPPKHYDVLDSQTYDVNRNANTYVRYENRQSQSTEMGLTVSRDWGLSSSLEAKFGPINASLEASYGQNFKETSTAFREMSFGTKAWAASDDVIFRTETNYDVWEYPVYTDTSGIARGYIVVVFPRKVLPECTKDCEATVTARVDGKNPASFYTPNHENGNLLSYSIAPPSDVGTLIKTGGLNYLGANPYELWVEWKDVTGTEKLESSQLNVSVGTGGGAWGIKVGVKGSYGQGQVSTQKVSFQETSAIHIHFDGIDPNYSYWVEPYVYWSNEGGHLVVDYAAGPQTAEPATWWQTTYDRPDPTFNLPWKYGERGEAYRQLCKEITFDPASPDPDETVNVSARVRNYSLVGAYNVQVRFYRGDPDNGGTQIGVTQTIAQLNPLSSQVISIDFQMPSDDNSVEIYAVVDPDDQIVEMHEAYNKAYAILVAGTPNLTIASEDIEFGPLTPSISQTLRISATVQAADAPAANVPVIFWDGDPSQAGQEIGWDMIPQIEIDGTETAWVDWDVSGQYGTHEIWVKVDYEDADPGDNWAHKNVELEAYAFSVHLPVVIKTGP